MGQNIFISFILLLTIQCLYAQLNTYDEIYATKEMGYALMSYCKDTKILNWNISPIQKYPSPKDIIIFKNQTTNMGGFIGYDYDTNTIKLAFQGTKPWSIGNWIEDIKSLIEINQSYCDDCLIAKGFQDAYESIQSQVIDGFKQLRSIYPDSKISITGHSLGGAVASLCAVDLILNFNETNIVQYTFGCPRVGNQAWANWFKSVLPHQFRITLKDDPVPRLPPQMPNILGFYHPAQEIYYYSLRPMLYRQCDVNNGEDPNCADKDVYGFNVNNHNSYMGYWILTDIIYCQF